MQLGEKKLLAEAYIRMLTVLRQDLQNAFDAGLTYKNDLLRVQVSLNEAVLNGDQATDGLVLAKSNLARLIGQAGDTAFTLVDSVGATLLSPEALVQDQAARRPELRLLEAALAAQELQRKLLRAEQLPSVGLAVSGLASGGKAVNIKDGSDFMTTYYGLLNVRVPIFDWGRNANKVREQSFKIAAQQLQLEEVEEQIRLEVQQASLQLNQSVKRVSLSALSLQQSEEHLRLATDRLKAGTIVGKDVLEAQAIWQQAYSDLIDARIAYRVSLAAYRKANGLLQ